MRLLENLKLCLWLVLYFCWTELREKTLYPNSSQHGWPSCLGQAAHVTPLRVVLWNPALQWDLASVGQACEDAACDVALNSSWEEQPQGAGDQAGSCLVC